MSSICTIAFRSAPKWSSASNRSCDRAGPAVDKTTCFDVARWSESMPKLFALNFRSGLLIGCAIAIAVAAAAFAYYRYDTKTLKRTIRRDAVFCGVNTGLPGVSSVDEKGNWSGFNVDLCRAIATGIFDHTGKVRLIPLDA